MRNWTRNLAKSIFFSLIILYYVNGVYCFQIEMKVFSEYVQNVFKTYSDCFDI